MTGEFSSKNNDVFMENQHSEQQIKDLVDARVEAIKKRNIDDASVDYAANLVLFDIVGPLEYTGPNVVRNRLGEWFETFDENAPVQFEVVAFEVKAHGDLAFSHSLNHVSTTLKDGNKLDMWWRETQNWSKIDGAWKVLHSHSSVPFDPQTGKPSLDLKPDSSKTT